MGGTKETGKQRYITYSVSKMYMYYTSLEHRDLEHCIVTLTGTHVHIPCL